MTTPITADNTATFDSYHRALIEYTTVRSEPDNPDLFAARKYAALVRLASKAEAAQATSTIDWRDEQGRYAAPGADKQTNLLIAVILDHPQKNEVFAEGTITPDAETSAILDEAAQSLKDHPEP